MENEPVSNSYKLDAAPVEAGLAERLRQWVSADGRALVYRPSLSTVDMCGDIMRAAAALEGQSAEIAALDLSNKLFNRMLDSEREMVRENQASAIATEKALATANARIATLETADRENSELLEAAIEGQSYWQARAERAEAALEPFSAMGRVMEIRARVTFGKIPKDTDIVCESSGEAGMGILTMGHFRDAAALLPNAPGWSGFYKPLARSALADAQTTQGEGK